MQFKNINTGEIKEVTNLRMRDGRIFYTVRGAGIKSQKFFNNNTCLVRDGEALDGTYLKCAEGWELTHAPKERRAAVAEPAVTEPVAAEPASSPLATWQDCKKAHTDAVIIMRCGDFYETYEQDARVCADVLGITLTKRADGVLMAGFPYHALDSYLPKLIRAGHRVAICEDGSVKEKVEPQQAQVSEPQAEPCSRSTTPEPATQPTQPQLQTNGVTDALSMAFMPVFQNVAAQIEANIRNSVQAEIDALKAQARTQCTKIEVTMPQGNVNAVQGLFCSDFEHLVKIVASGKPLYMNGEAGCGKSFTAKQIADALGLEYFEVSQAMFAHDLKGYGDANGNYVETPLYKAVTKGGLFFLDEADGSAPEALIVLNNLIANKRFDFPVVGNVEAHPNFRVIAAGNTTMTGATIEYTARAMQDASFKNRFFFARQTYDPRIEIQLAGGDESIVEFAHDLRKAAKKANITQLCSYRQIQDLAELQQACGDDAYLLRGSVLQEKEADEAHILYENLENKENRWAKALKQCCKMLKAEAANA